MDRGAPVRMRLLTTPNLCSAFRLAMSPVLLLLAYGGETEWFVAGFSAALASDVADGLLARRLRLDSDEGARLDSWSDHAMYLTAAAGVCLLVPHLVRREAGLVGAMAAAYLLPVLYGFLKFRRLTCYHTWAAKLSAVLSSAAMLAMLLFQESWPLRIAGPVFIVSAIEELAITAALPRWQTNIPSWWHARRLRPADASDPAKTPVAGVPSTPAGRSEP